MSEQPAGVSETVTRPRVQNVVSDGVLPLPPPRRRPPVTKGGAAATRRPVSTIGSPGRPEVRKFHRSSSEGTIIKEGLLLKKVHNRHWKPRYVLLKDGMLHEYPVNHEKRPLLMERPEVIRLSGTSMLVNKVKFKFIVVRNEQHHAFKAESEESMADWIGCVSACQQTNDTPHFYEGKAEKFSKVAQGLFGGFRKQSGDDVAVPFSTTLSAQLRTGVTDVSDLAARLQNSIERLSSGAECSDSPKDVSSRLLSTLSGLISQSRKIMQGVTDVTPDSQAAHQEEFPVVDSCHDAAHHAAAKLVTALDALYDRTGDFVPATAEQVDDVRAGVTALIEAATQMQSLLSPMLDTIRDAVPQDSGSQQRLRLSMSGGTSGAYATGSDSGVVEERQPRSSVGGAGGSDNDDGGGATGAYVFARNALRSSSSRLFGSRRKSSESTLSETSEGRGGKAASRDKGNAAPAAGAEAVSVPEVVVAAVAAKQPPARMLPGCSRSSEAASHTETVALAVDRGSSKNPLSRVTTKKSHPHPTAHPGNTPKAASDEAEEDDDDDGDAADGGGAAAASGVDLRGRPRKPDRRCCLPRTLVASAVSCCSWCRCCRSRCRRSSAMASARRKVRRMSAACGCAVDVRTTSMSVWWYLCLNVTSECTLPPTLGSLRPLDTYSTRKRQCVPCDRHLSNTPCRWFSASGWLSPSTKHHRRRGGGSGGGSDRGAGATLSRGATRAALHPEPMAVRLVDTTDNQSFGQARPGQATRPGG
eukprot:m.349350 g.349350  ORF g.349350 m.349350 type:complete len:756 (-) comp19884_c3_seq1:332-2599(-)